MRKMHHFYGQVGKQTQRVGFLSSKHGVYETTTKSFSITILQEIQELSNIGINTVEKQSARSKL